MAVFRNVKSIRSPKIGNSVRLKTIGEKTESLGRPKVLLTRLKPGEFMDLRQATFYRQQFMLSYDILLRFKLT